MKMNRDRWTHDALRLAALEAGQTWALTTDVGRIEDQIESIIAEFGDQPVLCLQIIAEHIQLSRHYRGASE